MIRKILVASAALAAIAVAACNPQTSTKEEDVATPPVEEVQTPAQPGDETAQTPAQPGGETAETAETKAGDAAAQAEGDAAEKK